MSNRSTKPAVKAKHLAKASDRAAGNGSTSGTLREKFLSLQPKSTMVVTSIGHIEVREPTLKQRDEWLRRMGHKGDGKVEDGSQAWANVWLTVMCSHDPDSGEKIFKPIDERDLVNSPASGFVEQIAEAALALCKKGAADAKNSEATLN